MRDRGDEEEDGTGKGEERVVAYGDTAAEGGAADSLRCCGCCRRGVLWSLADPRVVSVVLSGPKNEDLLPPEGPDLGVSGAPAAACLI